MGRYARYFELAALVWADYFDGSISMRRRDALLDSLRAAHGIR